MPFLFCESVPTSCTFTATFCFHVCSTTYSNEIHPSVRDFMIKCRTAYSPAAIAILSNSVGTQDDINHTGAKLTEAGMQIPVILHAQKKPACLNEVCTKLSISYLMVVVRFDLIC